VLLRTQGLLRESLTRRQAIARASAKNATMARTTPRRPHLPLLIRMRLSSRLRIEVEAEKLPLRHEGAKKKG
jgi:hypothetical protein